MQEGDDESLNDVRIVPRLDGYGHRRDDVLIPPFSVSAPLEQSRCRPARHAQSTSTSTAARTRSTRLSFSIAAEVSALTVVEAPITMLTADAFTAILEAEGIVEGEPGSLLQPARRSPGKSHSSARPGCHTRRSRAG